MNLDNSKSQKIIVLFLSVILFSSVPAQMAYAVGFSFASQNISNDSGTSRDPQITSSGNNIYLIWRNSTSGINDIYFSNSTDGGTIFSIPNNLSSSSSTLSQLPQITFNGANVYAVWQEGNDVVFKKSANSGQSFASTINLSNSGTASTNIQIASTTNNVYATFSEGTNVFLSSSTNTGSSFDLPDNLSNSGTSSTTPQVATSGSDAFVVWREGNDISVIKATESGGTVSLGSIIPLSSSGASPISQKPQVAASGSNVFVVWQEGTNIAVKNSTDSGATFSTSLTDIGDTGGASAPNPQIVMSGNNVHVIWRDNTSGNGEIMYSRSIGGAAFTVPQNLSSNTGSSIKPQVAASGSNVYVTWRDNDSGNNEIIFRGSDDDGATFSTKSTLSPTVSSDNSDEPQIAISGSTAHVVWEEDTPTSDIFYGVGTPTTTSISFSPSGNLKLSDTPTITVTDSGTSGTINVNVKSSTGDTTGFNLSLNEISTGTHSGTLSFSETLDSSQTDRRLKANPGDTITVTFGSTQATNQIFSRTVTFDSSTYDRTLIANIEVDDKNSNTDTGNFDTVTVSVTSTANPSGISLVLTETGIDTGIFGGTSSSPVPQLIFFKNDGLIPEESTVTLSEEDTRLAGTSGALNTDANVIDTITQDITSTSESQIVRITLSETGSDTGIFSGTLTLSNTASDNATSTLFAVGKDILTLTGQSASSVLRALVTPIGTYQGAIKVTNSDTVIATLGLSTDSATVIESLTGSGGGGGGLVSPGLVVNALAGLGGGGGSPTTSLNNLLSSRVIDVPEEIEQMVFNHDSYSPLLPMDPNSFEGFDLPLVINDQGFVLGGFTSTLQTQTIKTDTPVTIKFTVYTTDKVQHFSLYTNLRDANDSISKSDTQILYNDGKDLTIIDPQGFFSDAKITVTEEDSIKKYILVEITFAKEMETSHIITRMWDSNLRSGDTHILDAIKVESEVPEFNPLPQLGEVQVEELKSQTIPKWVKNNAEWWVDNQIDDESFVTGIQYLINNGIMYVPNDKTVNSVTEIPDWIKNNAEWWADNQISDDDFVKAMEWLVTNGVIRIE